MQMSTEITSAAQQKMDFMTLLVTELRNQNPLEPMDNQQMAAQLAQISQLELSEEMNTNLGTLNTTVSGMNSSFENALWMAKTDHAKSLLGKTVNFYEPTSGLTLEGTAKKLTFDAQGEPVLTIRDVDMGSGEYKISLNQVTGIQG
jgi:flagellar basal-body rod modification protein FlgD